MKEWALVRTYNFDTDIRIWLFDTEEEACQNMEFQYSRDIEAERKEYADEDPEKVFESKCFCEKEAGMARLAWRNDQTYWEDTDEYDYCLWQVQKVEGDEQ